MIEPKKSIVTRFMHSAAGVLIARVLAFVAVFGFNAVLARALSPTDFGQFMLMFSLAGLASLIGCFGLNRALVKRLAEMMTSVQSPGLGSKRKRQLGQSIRRTVNTGIVTGIVGGGLVGLLGGWVYYVLGSAGSEFLMSSNWTSVWFGVAIWLRTVHLVVAETARGFNEKIWSNLFGGPAGGPLPHLIFLLLLIGAWYWFSLSSLAMVVVLYCVSFAGTLPLLIARVKTLGPNRVECEPVAGCVDAEREFETHADGVMNESLVWLALPLMFTQAFGLTMSQADVWLAGAFAAPAALAVYCAAQRMLAFLTIPLQIAGTGIVSFVPELIAQKKTVRLQEVVGLAATLAGVPGLAIGVCFFLFPETILSIAFGPFYASAAPLLRILAIGQMICIFTGPCEIVLMMAGHHNKTLVVNTVAAIAIFSLGPLGIFLGGMMGLAIAISCITSLQNLANWILAKRLLGVSTNVGAIHLKDWSGSLGKFRGLVER